MAVLDQFNGRSSDLTIPLTRVQRSTHAAADFEPKNVSRLLSCGSDGVLKVDLLGGDVDIEIQVFKGNGNPWRVTKIYDTGSSEITVDCCD